MSLPRTADDLVSANVPFLWLTNSESIAALSRFQYRPRFLKRFNEGGWYMAHWVGGLLVPDLERARHISPCNTVAIEAVKSCGSSTFLPETGSWHVPRV